MTFESFETVIFKCQFWNSIIRQRGLNAIVLEDKCGFECVKASSFLSNFAIDDNPFIFPKDVNQLFYVDEAIHVGWKLAMKVNSSSKLVVYKRARGKWEEHQVFEAFDVPPLMV